jgi:hypothetical protein
MTKLSEPFFFTPPSQWPFDLTNERACDAAVMWLCRAIEEQHGAAIAQRILKKWTPKQRDGVQYNKRIALMVEYHRLREMGERVGRAAAILAKKNGTNIEAGAMQTQIHRMLKKMSTDETFRECVEHYLDEQGISYRE